jgi:hypothetical protein
MFRQKVFWFDEHLFNLAKTFTKQSLLKHVLTEGDKMLIALLSEPVDQGIYAFVFNYGKLNGSIIDSSSLSKILTSFFFRITDCANIVSTIGRNDSYIIFQTLNAR